MKCATRTAAVLLLGLMLPLQGWAAACAQICALASASRDAVMIQNAALHHADAPQQAPGSAPEDSSDHCGKSEMGAGKCCQAHIYLTQPCSTSPSVSIPSFERHQLLPRWTSFISEEPTPPPIASSRIA